MSPDSTIKQILELEQYFLDYYFNNPLNLNSDCIASGSGKHFPMSEQAKIRLRKQRGISFFLYDMLTTKLIHVFDSKTFAQLKINIDHRTLNNCLINGTLYLNRFMFSFETILEKHSEFDNVLSLIELNNLLNSVRNINKNINQPASKSFAAYNLKNPLSPFCKTYHSINEFAKVIKGDRSTIQDYVNGNKPEGSLYRNE